MQPRDSQRDNDDDEDGDDRRYSYKCLRVIALFPSKIVLCILFFWLLAWDSLVQLIVCDVLSEKHTSWLLVIFEDV